MAYHLVGSGKSLYVAVEVNCEKGAITDIKAQVPSVRTNWRMLDNLAFVIWLGIKPIGGRRSWHINITYMYLPATMKPSRNDRNK